MNPINIEAAAIVLTIEQLPNDILAAAIGLPVGNRDALEIAFDFEICKRLDNKTWF